MVGLFGGLSYVDVILVFSVMVEEEGFMLFFFGYVGEVEFDGDKILYMLLGELLSISVDEFFLEMKNLFMDMSYDGDMVVVFKGDLFEFIGKVCIESIEIFNIELGVIVKIENLVFVIDVKIDEDNNIVNVYVEYVVDKVVGFEFDVIDMVLGVVINNLDIDFIKVY